MRILITGIHGFVGGNLVRTLRKDHELYGLDIVIPEAAGVTTTFNWEEMDSVPRVEALIHLAGKAHDTRNTSAAQSYFDINLGLTQKIFDYFLQSDAEKFIFFSSIKAVADTVSGCIFTEEAIPNPKTPYGQSKLAAEQYILSKIRDNTQSSPFLTVPPNIQNPKPETRNAKPETQNPNKVYILRPCMIHGPGNKGNLNLLYKLVKKGIPWPLGAFENQRSFLSIENLSFIIRQIMDKDIPPGTYHLADDDPVSTNEIIDLIAQSLKRKAIITRVPKGVIHALARSGDVLHMPLNSERLKKLTESYVVSNAKIKGAMKTEKLPVSTKEGLLNTFNSFSLK